MHYVDETHTNLNDNNTLGIMVILILQNSRLKLVDRVGLVQPQRLSQQVSLRSSKTEQSPYLEQKQ